ncbi:MAG: hypothetical protein WBV45_01890 [Lutimonas sp.]
MKETDKNKKGFCVPENYFESLESKLTTRLKDGSKNGLKVPAGYFDEFEVKPPAKSRSTEVKKLFWMAAAASILLFFGVKYMDTNQSTLDWDDLEQAEISSWIESDFAELNTYDIAEAYPDVELNPSMISNEELNSYLNEIELDEILYEN